MSWQIPVLLRLVTAYVIGQPLIKVLTGDKKSPASQTRKFLMQFIMCSAFALLLASVRGWSRIGEPTTLMLLGLGIANTLGAYCQWKSIAHSLSKYALFTMFDDVIAMALSFAILKEGQLLNGTGVIGVSVSLLAFLLFALDSYPRGKGEEAATPFSFFGYVAGYSVVWGGAFFLMRYFALGEVPIEQFAVGWYGGTTLGAVLMCVGGIELNPTCRAPLRFKDKGLVSITAIFVFVSLMLGYWSYQLAPQTMIQPIYLLGEMIIPALVGLWYFKEGKGLLLREWAYFGIGLAGGTLIFLG
jgi:hypothetical protein